MSTYWCVFFFRENSFFTPRFLQGFLKNKIRQALIFFKTFWFVQKLLLVYSFFTARFPQEEVTRSIETFEYTSVLPEVVARICTWLQLWESIWADCWIGRRHLDFAVWHNSPLLWRICICVLRVLLKGNFCCIQRSLGLLFEIVLFVWIDCREKWVICRM